MKDIRTTLDSDESVERSHHQEIITFYGSQKAVRLVWRGKDDPHICFEILSEDDEYWFLMNQGGGSSSYWMPDLRRVLMAAERWMRKNAKPDIYNGHQYGYKIV